MGKSKHKLCVKMRAGSSSQCFADLFGLRRAGVAATAVAQ